MTLDGQIALVTGGAKRVGRAIALELARAGADIALHYHSSAETARTTAKEITGIGRQCELFRADLANPHEIDELFAALADRFSRLDILVNNAAVYHRTPIDTLTAETWDTELAVNARAPALCIRHAIPLMRERGGVIVNIVDSAAEKGRADYPAYCASKAALLALTKSAAKALAPGIRVNAVSPGVALFPEDVTQEYKESVLELVPLKRSGTPEDIARAVLFLARQPYITAQNLRVDGGWNMG
ncbi:MAG: SDR family NAD(P)-dependent oxidoreductase [Planctomycetota bacterium]|jgi:NAD(P)-dependent dehydrogenase (short-subunit alcohol dehydrogenase family)